MTTVATPEQGQLVQVFSHPWMVNEVKPSNLPNPAMMLPVESVILRLFDAEQPSSGECEECLSHWESQGRALGRRAVFVEARKVPDRVIAIVQPVEAAKKRDERAKLFSE